MSDPNENPNPPAEGTAPASTPAHAPAESYSAADVERILMADREQRQATPSEPDDPVAKFRASTSGSKLYGAKPGAAKQPAQPPQGSRLESLVESMLALQIAQMKPPAPPAPPKPMTHAEKLASTDPDIFLRRGANAWTTADSEAQVADYAAALRKQGFQGNVEEEAESRARKERLAAANKALGNIKIHVGGPDLSMLTGRK